MYSNKTKFPIGVACTCNVYRIQFLFLRPLSAKFREQLVGRFDFVGCCSPRGTHGAAQPRLPLAECASRLTHCVLFVLYIVRPRAEPANTTMTALAECRGGCSSAPNATETTHMRMKRTAWMDERMVGLLEYGWCARFITHLTVALLWDPFTITCTACRHEPSEQRILCLALLRV